MKGFMFLKTIVLSAFLVISPLAVSQELSPYEEPSSISTEVNINQADAQTIANVLSGIGLRKAEAIVAYRDANGSFSTVDDLIMVKGIGELTVIRNQEKIVFE